MNDEPVVMTLGTVRVMGTRICPKCRADQDAYEALKESLEMLVSADNTRHWLKALQVWAKFEEMDEIPYEA